MLLNSQGGIYMKTQSALLNRCSCREFTEEQIKENELEAILQAANAAPVSLGNYDDVELCIIQNADIIEEIEQTVSSILPSMGVHSTYKAPTLILINCKRETAEKEHLPYCNASCIAENIMISATDLGLGSVYLYAVPFVLSQVPHFYEKLEIQKDFFPVVAVAVGNPKKQPQLRESQSEKINKKIF